MPYNPVKTKRFSIQLPLPAFKKLQGLAKKIDRSVADAARGLILTSLPDDQECKK